MDVLFVTVGDEQTASTRHRVLDIRGYLDEQEMRTNLISFQRFRSRLPKWGIITKIAFISLIFAKSFGKDIVYIQKVPLPWPVISLLQLISGNVVFDFDDALYTSPEWKSENQQRKKWLKQSLRSSSAVIVGNPNLRDFAERYNKNVHVLPTPVPKVDSTTEEKSDGSPITLGWIGHPANLRYLKAIENPVQQILQDFDAELSIITGDDRPALPFIERTGKDVHYNQWSLSTEEEGIRRFDIMLRPMPNTEWIQGKGGYTSIIRCMSLGIPVIASPIEPLLDMTTPGKSILIADDDDEWYNMIRELVKNEEMRHEVGKSAKNQVGENNLWADQYSLKLAKVLSSINGEENE